MKNIILVIFFLTLTSHLGHASEQPKGTICEGWDFIIAPDMQMTDDNFTLEVAEKSAEWLKLNFDKTGTLNEFRKENSLKLIIGYIYKSSVINSEEYNKEALKIRYCTWLKKDGFWYD